MTNFDLVLRGGEAILHGRTACDIAIRDERIAAIVGSGEQLAAATEICVRGLIVFPGAVDVHLHLGHGKDIAGRAFDSMPIAKRQPLPKAASPVSFLI
jgi:dihydropyrimidinase